MIGNLNKLAKYIAEQETGKVEVSIAQIKEILKILCVAMVMNPEIIAKMINRGNKLVKK